MTVKQLAEAIMLYAQAFSHKKKYRGLPLLVKENQNQRVSQFTSQNNTRSVEIHSEHAF